MSNSAKKMEGSEVASDSSRPKNTRYPWNFILSSSKEAKYMLLSTSVILFFILFTNVITYYSIVKKTDFDTAGVGTSFFETILLAFSTSSFVLYIITSILIYFATLKIAFRFAGPLIPITRHVDALIAGNYQHRILFRKGDPFIPLQTKLNELAQRLEDLSKKN